LSLLHGKPYPSINSLSHMTNKFIYEEKTSRLYAPDGTYLKTLSCPKAIDWNQLIMDDPLDRSRGCDQCGERVLNLDAMPAEDVLAVFDATSTHSFRPCVAASRNSDKVIFLKDETKPSHSSIKDDLPLIHTARTYEDINRAASAGFWPDVRWIEYKDSTFGTKLCIGQDPVTGKIDSSGDFRSMPKNALFPFMQFYPYYQSTPIAAYLIPKELPDGTEVIVADPIEEIVGFQWNQGDCYKATDLRGVIRNRKVELQVNEGDYEPMFAMG
jgi:hypothetical protein